MRRNNLVAIACLYLLTLWGCGQQVVLVPPGGVVRLAEPVSALVATPGKDATGATVWTVGANRVTLPQGWYVVPPPPSTTQPSTNP
jgi:hypothetical protein